MQLTYTARDLKKIHIYHIWVKKKAILLPPNKTTRKKKKLTEKKINKQKPENKYGENWGPVLFQGRAVIFFFFSLLELQGLFGDRKRRMSANNKGKWQLCFQESDYKER